MINKERNLNKVGIWCACALTWAQLLLWVPLSGAVQFEEDDPALQRYLLNSCERASSIQGAGWHMSATQPEVLQDVEPKLGDRALWLGGDSEIRGGKGDFVVAKGPFPGRVYAVGAWLWLPENTKVQTVGFQITDGENERLKFLVDANWSGWKWVQCDLGGAGWEQAYAQKDKNGTFDQSLKGVNVIFFAGEPGVQGVGLDGLIALAEVDDGARVPDFEIQASDTLEPGSILSSRVLVHNYQSKALELDLEYRIQVDAQLLDVDAVDPALGRDHAAAGRCWTEVNGQRVSEGSFLDGKAWTGCRLDWSKEGYEVAVQFLDLGQVRKVTHVRYRAQDANWIFKLDVDSSLDGETYTPVPEWQHLDVHKKWNVQDLPKPAPFDARYLRFRYFKDDGPERYFSMPTQVWVFDGMADEKLEWPEVGPQYDRGHAKMTVPPRSWALSVPLGTKAVEAGAFLQAVRCEAESVDARILQAHSFVLPPKGQTLSSSEKFGVNASTPSLASWHKRQGLGWVRFENAKSFMYTGTERDGYHFDGSVTPWRIPLDSYFDTYAQEGLQILPFLFGSQRWNCSVPEDVDRRIYYPPESDELFGEYCAQFAARFGATKHAAEDLLTTDKVSGKNQVSVYEIWNEPNLNAPKYGAWVGELEDYMDTFCVAARAIRKADPKGRITNGGMAGIELSDIDLFRTHQAEDGSHPVDWMDVLNVHYYTGRDAPELSGINYNIHRSGIPGEARSFEQRMKDLVEWVDRVKPGLELWLTETGYDTIGGQNVSERLQAAWLVRECVNMLELGVDKIFVYREKDSGRTLYSSCGMIRKDGSLKPVWFALAHLIRELDGAEKPLLLKCSNENVRMVSWRRNGQPLVMAWSINGEPEKLPLDTGSVRVTDAFGAVSEMADGTELVLGDFPVYLDKMEHAEAVKTMEESTRKLLEEQRALLQQQQALKTVLIDFGSREHVARLKLGTWRRYTPVMHDDLYSAKTGFGFLPGKTAMRSGYKAWMKDDLNGDSSAFNKDTVFRLTPPPGTYRMEMAVEPFQSTGSITLTVTQGEQVHTLTFTRKEMEKGFVVQGGTPLEVSVSDYASLRWITLIEQ